MNAALRIGCGALALWVVTLGLGYVGWELDPWGGEAGGGESPLLLFGLPLLVCVIALSSFIHPALAFLVGGVVQFAACLTLAGGVWALSRLVRRPATEPGR